MKEKESMMIFSCFFFFQVKKFKRKTVVVKKEITYLTTIPLFEGVFLWALQMLSGC